MFEHIKGDLKYRVQDLKLQLMKRFDIESDVEESFSDSESESESESEIENEKIKTPNLKSIFGPPGIELKLTADGDLDIDGKCLTNVEDLDKPKSDSEIENEKIKSTIGLPIRFKITKDGKLEFNGKWINNIEDIDEIKSKYDIDIIKIISENSRFFGIPIGMENLIDEPKSESESDDKKTFKKAILSFDGSYWKELKKNNETKSED